MKMTKIAAPLVLGALFIAGSSYGKVTTQKNPEQVMYELNLHFETGKADINPQYKADIQKVADEMKNHPYATAQIEGYADATGSEAFNRELSRKRADTLKQYLTDQYGIEGKRLTAVGFGGTKPVAENSTKSGMQRNRAVLVTVNRYMTSQQDQAKQPQ